MGRVDLVDIFRYNTADDGAGGIIESGEVLIYGGIKARISIMTANAERGDAGVAGEEKWKVLLSYSPTIHQAGDVFLRLTSGVSVIQLDKVYRILSCRHQRDEYNVWHHTSLTIEKED